MPRDKDHDTDPAPPPRPTPFPSGTRLTLRLGDTGEAIAIIQRAVGVADTGLFDTMTEVAVRAFQTSHGLPPTGVVDVKTWMVISSEPAP